ncbi:unnamed protein product [Lathyrus sativus]|nr:unnamed protein product [Lathyrus sativus]
MTGTANVHNRYRKPIFKSYNCIMDFEGYSALVEKNWNIPIAGNPMFILWNKLMRLQPALRNFSKPARHNDQQLIQARNRLNTAQSSLEADPMNATILTRIKEQKLEILKLEELEKNILRQKSKLDWLKWGDGNNSYFHASVKSKNNSKNISHLTKEDGTVLTVQADIENEVLDYYKNLLGTADSTIRHIDVAAMRDGPQLNMDQRLSLLAPITEQEIHTALKGIRDLKSPRIDGYGACFFKGSWETIKFDVVTAVQDFFRHDRLFKAFNGIVVTLIPKHYDAQSIKDYRPIAGCTTVYKIISKILTTRLGNVIGDIVHNSQAAFVPGQQIHNHILLAYELIKGYTRKGGTPRCMLQIDLQKAYDMVNWDALECIMKEIGIPTQFSRWIMITVTSVTYKFNINEYHTKTIQAKRGLRQGDPISPILFVIIMEYLNRCFRKMQKNPNFNHHAKCEKLHITNLSFADDLLLFSRGDCMSVELLMEAFNGFSDSTGLKLNPAKCKIYFGGVDADTKQNIINITNFREGPFPFRYLGVPLTSKKLSIHHYMPLIDKIMSRINHWSAKLLSYAGHAQLIKSVTFAIANYWMQCLPIPRSVIHKIEAMCRSFMWTGGADISRKSPIAWDNVCRPLNYGGLGIIDLKI